MSARIECGFDAPEIAEDGDRVTWTWSLRNSGDQDATDVVFTSKLIPALKVVEATSTPRSLPRFPRHATSDQGDGASANSTE
ncbi:hypothetical protein [Allokutzneria sp. NRRL B-24872]|uniref:hypothetical protein n=1 Tax=Allokutzneria sp. NRRL B-24872 TaxID=1137961 RepID=UPI000A37CEE1|nr:hypothetical protein [Allokutzneria sp. NRRL B-24872]